MVLPVSAVRPGFGRVTFINEVISDRLRQELPALAKGEATRAPTVNALRRFTGDPQIRTDAFIPKGASDKADNGIYPANRFDFDHGVSSQAQAGLFSLGEGRGDVIVTNDIDRKPADDLGPHKPADFMDLDRLRDMLGETIRNDAPELVSEFFDHERALAGKRHYSPIWEVDDVLDDDNTRIRHYERVETWAYEPIGPPPPLGRNRRPVFGRVSIVGPTLYGRIKDELRQYADRGGPLMGDGEKSALSGLREGTGDGHLAGPFFNPFHNADKPGINADLNRDADAGAFDLPFGWGALITNDHRKSRPMPAAESGLDVKAFDDLDRWRAAHRAASHTREGVGDMERFNAAFVGQERALSTKRQAAPIEEWTLRLLA
ncbi:MAG: hypothetical protein KC474_04735 [Cyanobacteria bacterium HKST-UBA04]|nr:hypothetical protein [Cyanobacteria bacterium HKST-UBA04]